MFKVKDFEGNSILVDAASFVIISSAAWPYWKTEYNTDFLWGG